MIDGAPLVILPGLMCDSRMFGAMMNLLPGASALDGYYGGHDRLDAMAAWALDRLPAKAVLFGHSMGGRIALEIVRQAPERVAGLVLADTGIHPRGEGEQENRYRLRDVGRAQGFGALVDLWLPPMVAPANRKPDILDPLRSMVLDAGQAVFEAQTEALLHRCPVDELLARIDCPALVMTGEHDAWSPPDQHAEIAAAIAGARLRIIEGAGHMAPAEAPRAVADAILRT